MKPKLIEIPFEYVKIWVHLAILNSPVPAQTLNKIIKHCLALKAKLDYENQEEQIIEKQLG